MCICLPGRNERSNGQRSNGSGFRSAAATLYGDDYINYECDGLVSDDDAIGSASFFLLFRLVIYFCFSVIFLFPWCLSSGSFWKVRFLLFSRRWENPAQSLVIYLNVRHVREKPPTKREISHLSFAVFLFRSSGSRGSTTKGRAGDLGHLSYSAGFFFCAIVLLILFTSVEWTCRHFLLFR